MDFTQQSKRVAAIIVAAGTGSRFRAAVPKQYVHLGSKPVVRHSIETFLACGIKDIITVIHPDHYELYIKATMGLDIHEPALGGASRAQSTFAGLKALQVIAPDYVLIHDAARPFIDSSLIKRVINGLDLAPGCIPAVPVTDTIKLTSHNQVQQTLPRECLWRAQTPQGFHYATILDCFSTTEDFSFTDESALLESVNIPVRVVDGSEENIKITFSGDLKGN